MTNAFQSLRSGIEADINVMVDNQFRGADEAIINDIYMCVQLMKIGSRTFTPAHWAEAWKLYGLNSYSKINAFLQKHITSKQRTFLIANRLKPLNDKKDTLEKYVELPPALRRKKQININPHFQNTYSHSQAFV